MKISNVLMALAVAFSLGLSVSSFAYSNDESEAKENVFKKFSKEDRKWCGGRHKYGTPFKYGDLGGRANAEKQALESCIQDGSECAAVNCLKERPFGLCEKLRKVDTACNGSPRDFLYKKK